MTRDAIPCTHMTRDEAFALFDRIAQGFSLAGGPTCEALVQDISDEGCVVLAIYNGHVSGRRVGSTLSIYGSDTSIEDEGAGEPFDPFTDTNCDEARTADGRRIKSSTWLVRGEGYVLALGVNVDVTEISRAAEILTGLAAVGGSLRDRLMVGEAKVADDADSLMEECLSQLGKPAEALSKMERIELVRLLSARGFFDYQRSAPALAVRLGVSKSTIYNYLHALHTEVSPCGTCESTSVDF